MGEEKLALFASNLGPILFVFRPVQTSEQIALDRLRSLARLVAWSRVIERADSHMAYWRALACQLAGKLAGLACALAQ